MLPVSNEYIGEIVNAELQENNGKVAAVIIARPNGSPETARWFGSFSETVISGGRNEGRVVGEVTAETLGAFGCTDFTKIGQLVGQKCAFGVKHKPGENGKVFVECNFIRPPRAANPATPAGIASINRFRGAAIEAARKAPKPSTQSKPMREPGEDNYDQLDNESDPFA
jgi:hypothetical protein